MLPEELPGAEELPGVALEPLDEVSGLVDEPLDELEGVLVEPLAPLLAPAAALKCSSHSERDTWPSLFWSTEEKFGMAPVAPLAALPVESVLLEPLAPVLSLDGAPVLPAASLLPSAKAAPESANSAAAVAVARILSFMCWLL